MLKRFLELYARIPFAQNLILLIRTALLLLSRLVLMWDTPHLLLASKLMAVERCNQLVVAVDSMVTEQVGSFASIPPVVSTTVVTTAG